MKSIWKYSLRITDCQEVTMPFGAKVLSVQVQHGAICIWALVQPTNSVEHRTFCVFGTGHSIANSDALRFIGTVQTNGGGLVWHIFEQPKN